MSQHQQAMEEVILEPEVEAGVRPVTPSVPKPVLDVINGPHKYVNGQYVRVRYTDPKLMEPKPSPRRNNE